MSSPGVQDAPDAVHESTPVLTAVVVTYRRPTELQVTLAALLGQSRPPDGVVIVDNDPAESARTVSDETGAMYLPTGANLGPSGGVAAGIRHVMANAKGSDRIVIIDDDDPPQTVDTLERLLVAFDSAQERGRPRCAGVGVVGARYVPSLGRFHRVGDSELIGLVPVDFIGGGQCPIYSVEALRTVGTLDPGYFFGFEEAHLGLELRRSGWTLLVPGDLLHERRQANDRLGAGTVTRATVAPIAWRQFYSSRNIVHLARRFGTPGGFCRTVCRGLVLTPCHRLLMRNGSAGAAWASVRGTAAGIRGQRGRTLRPE